MGQIKRSMMRVIDFILPCSTKITVHFQSLIVTYSAL